MDEELPLVESSSRVEKVFFGAAELKWSDSSEVPARDGAIG
jgi:hypothetical protein